MVQFPYGIADFRRIRQEGMVYVDRTAHIRDLEQLGSVLAFLRPRRFGKSLWLQTLANYYDLRRKDEFDALFGGLAIGREPTPRANRYFILDWNFSLVSPRGGVDRIAASLEEHVRSRAEVFARQYRDVLPEPVHVEGNSSAILDHLLSLVSETPYKLYLLIDEYDNFVNEVMAKDAATYKALFENDGPFKELFKTVKSATEGRGMERVFVTGVAPVALNDLTSGFNNAKNVSSHARLATLCGFQENEIRDLLDVVVREHELSHDVVEAAIDTMRTWYNGYRFSTRAQHLVYNPINTLYFLENLAEGAALPEELQDQNLRADRGKIAFAARTAAGSGLVEELTEGGDGTVRISRLITSFSVQQLTTQLAKDRNVVASFLYYMGILTLADVPLRLRIPNLVVRKLLLDRLLEIFLPDVGESAEARLLALSAFQDGKLEPLLEFFEGKLLPVLSNRDRGAAPKSPGHGGSGVNEMVLFEFKLVRRKELGLEGRKIREADEHSLRDLPQVREAFTAARKQVKRYRAALVRKEGEALNLRCWAVVAVGLERILGEEIV